MQQFLMAFYVVFFATGFMGGTALLLLSVRVRSRLLRPLLVFQLLFLTGMGLILLYFARSDPALDDPDSIDAVLLAAINAINAAVWVVVVVLTRRVVPETRRRTGLPVTAEILAVLVIVKSLANAVVASIPMSAEASAVWHLGGHLLSALAMGVFGFVLRGPVNRREIPALASLLNAYGTIAIIFAPIGLIEYAVQAARLPWLSYISLDHVFYLAWNVVSMTAAFRLFRPVGEGVPLLDGVPEERVKALGLSPRELEMAILIGRGLTNKEIAARLFISPATVRTHIYNLYQKVGAGSRVELINMLRS